MGDPKNIHERWPLAALSARDVIHAASQNNSRNPWTACGKEVPDWRQGGPSWHTLAHENHPVDCKACLRVMRAYARG